MSALSKLCGRLGFDVVPYNCYELVHNWHPNCESAMVDVYRHAIPYSYRTYLPLYLISLLMRGRLNSVDPVKFAVDLTRSSLFLATNGAMFLYFMCLMRWDYARVLKL